MNRSGSSFFSRKALRNKYHGQKWTSHCAVAPWARADKRRRAMGNVFNKKPKVTDTDRAILALKTQRRKLTAQQRQLDVVIEREKEVARDLLQQKKKDRALLTLKRKKAQEELQKKIDVWLLNVEQQLADIDTASRQKALFDSLKAGNKAIQDLQKEVNVEDIQKLVEDSAEAQAYQDEINEALGQQLTVEDNEAVLAEFENLEQELELGDLPNVPETTLPTGQEPESPERLPVREEVVADASEGIMPIRSKEKESTHGTEVDADADDLDLPSVPTSQVLIPERGGSGIKSLASSRRAEEPLPAQ